VFHFHLGKSFPVGLTFTLSYEILISQGSHKIHRTGRKWNVSDESEPIMIQACWLSYDIPDDAELSEEPCDVLRPIAFHRQKSVWIIQEGDIPYHYVNELQQAESLVDIVRFDASEAPKLLRMCIETITKDIRDTVASARANAASAEARLQAAEEPDAAFNAYARDRNRIIRTMGRNLRDLRTLAERFHVADRIPALDTCVSAVAAIQVSMLQRAKAYADTTRELARELGETNAMVRAARASRVPGAILADFAEENGVDGSELRSRFWG